MNKTSEERHKELSQKLESHTLLLQEQFEFACNGGNIKSTEYMGKNRLIKAEWKLIKEEMKALKIKPLPSLDSVFNKILVKSTQTINHTK
jgi:hypothetical protein